MKKNNTNKTTKVREKEVKPSLFSRIKWTTRKDEKVLEKPKMDSTDTLIKGKLLTCIHLSVISAFVDIVFFSGLSKSGYPFFGVLVPAAIILSLMSVGFSLAKFFFAMQISLTKELQNHLLTQGYAWAKKLTWARLGYEVIHKFLIIVSIVTSLSLSVITIGNGVRRMEQTINSMTTDTQYLIELRDSKQKSTKDKNSDAQKSISDTRNAKDSAVTQADRYWPNIEKWQNRLAEIYAKYPVTDTFTDADRKALIDNERKPYKNMAPTFVGNNIDYISYDELIKGFRATTEANNVLDTTALFNESIKLDEEAITEYIAALQTKHYTLPDGTPIDFITSEGNLVNVSEAISNLQRAIMEWQCDTGDAGASSKVFTLVATYLHADEKAGGMAASEKIMMFLIFIFGVIQEVIIAKLTPMPIITRKLTSQYRSYIDWSNFDTNRFLIKVYDTYLETNVLSTEEYNKKVDKAIDQIARKESGWVEAEIQERIELYKIKAAKKKKVPTDYTTNLIEVLPPAVESKINEIAKEIE